MRRLLFSSSSSSSTRRLVSINRSLTSIADDTPTTALVQGASRGLGLEFVRQLLQRPTPHHVIATCRSPESAISLQHLHTQHPTSLTILPLDTTNPHSIQTAADRASQHVGDTGIDLLINVSGILHVPGGLVQPETALARISLEALQTVFASNTFGPILVCQAFAPLLVTASKHRRAVATSLPTTASSTVKPSVVANMSARVGSIGDNRLGGWYSYRASKAALNQLTKTMAIELRRKNQNVAAILLHPGTVDTDLSKPFQKNVAPEKLFTRERAVEQLLRIIDGVEMKDTGKYYAWDGSEIPW